MAHEAAAVHHTQTLALPSTVTGLTDVTRLEHEAATLDEYLRQAALRKGGDANMLPKIPVMLDDVATLNHLNLLHEADRQKLAAFLKSLQTSAPTVHMSFASEPSAEFTAKIVTWLRQNIHPLLLVQFGLQPSIAAGCTLRTTNKVFDFSLRQHLVRNRQLLVDAIARLGEQPDPVPQSAAHSADPISPLPKGAVQQ
jgi:F0F1-type ATP synthase delta subunit